MKKSPTNRVRRNGSKAAASSQVQNRRSRMAALTETGADVVTLVLTVPNGKEFCRVDFPGAIYARMEAAMKKLGIGISEFCEQAMRTKLGRELGTKSRPEGRVA